jgi:hypothetical protein
MRKIIALAALAALAGCGGGGGSSTPATTQQQQPTQQSPTTVNMTVTFPASVRSGSGAGRAAQSARSPKFVSPNTAQIRVVVNTVNTAAPPSWVATNTVTPVIYSPAANFNCTVSGGTATCTIPVAAPPGVVNYTITAEDSGGAHVLARHTQDVTIVQGTTNTPTFTLNGVVATVNVSLPALTANTSQSGATVTWSALDASGAQIVGGTTFENAITLTDTDATGQTQLHVNGGSGAITVQVTKPTDAVTLDYTGQADNPFSVNASGTGITGSGSVTPTVFDVTFTGTTLDNAGAGGVNTDPNWSEPTLFFAQPSGSQNVTGVETGFTNAPYSQQFVLDEGPNSAPWCAYYAANTGAIATFSPLSPTTATTFTITAAKEGVCKVRLKEAGTGYPITTHPAPANATDTTHDGTFWVSVTSATFTVNGHRRQGH